MSKILLAALGLFLALLNASSAQILSPAFSFPPVGSIPAYTGPGNIQTFLDWWGVRAYSSATRGTRAANVCTADAGGGTCADFATSGSTGDLIVTTIGGTNCSVSTCYVHKLYDKAGSTTLTDIGHSPTLRVSCLNSMPCIVFNGTTNVLCGSTGSALNQPISHYAVVERTSAFTSVNEIVSNYSNPGATNGPQTYAYTTANHVAGVAGGTAFTATMSDSAWHVLMTVFNSSSSVLSVDGVDTTGNPGTGNGTSAGNVCLGEADTNGTGGWLNGDMTEAGMTATSISSGNRTSLCHNAYLFWATSTSC
jgi:hypothetical protein